MRTAPKWLAFAPYPRVSVLCHNLVPVVYQIRQMM